MRAQDFISNFLDLIDKLNEPRQEPEEQQLTQVVVLGKPQDQAGELSPLSNAAGQGDDIRRFKQIVDLANGPDEKCYDTRPEEAYASIEAVTTDAGGGMQAPKDPADIRSDSVAMYPGKVYGAR